MHREWQVRTLPPAGRWGSTAAAEARDAVPTTGGADVGIDKARARFEHGFAGAVSYKACRGLHQPTM